MKQITRIRKAVCVMANELKKAGYSLSDAFKKAWKRVKLSMTIRAAGTTQWGGKWGRKKGRKGRATTKSTDGKNSDSLGVRVEIFLRLLQKNTTRPLTVWIVGTDVERRLFFVIGYGILYRYRYSAMNHFYEKLLLNEKYDEYQH